jgi:hypothetical protein
VVLLLVKSWISVLGNTSSSVTTTTSSKKSLAAQKTAAKVQLMKLKMKSVGLASLPEAERTYFLVQPPRAEAAGHACFVSSRWSLGKVAAKFLIL